MTSVSVTAMSLSSTKRRCTIAAIGGAVICAAGFLLNQDHFYQSYLLGYLLWIGVALGSLAIVMIHHLTGGGWGEAIRPVLQSAIRTLPWFVPLFIPLAFGLRHVYVWASPTADDHAIQGTFRSQYLSSGFFLLRTSVYFILWNILALKIQQIASPAEASPGQARKARSISAPGLAIYGLTVSMASVDWVMSLEPEWFSTIYGMSFALGQVLSALAFAVLMFVWLPMGEPESEAQASRLHDLGNLLLTFVMLWAYLAFSQYLIIWSGDLLSEITWYKKRGSGVWGALIILVIVFYFAVPFLLLLSRQIKRHAVMLSRIALCIVLFRALDLFWVIAPAFHPDGFALHWLDVVVPLTLGAVWLATFAHYRQTQLAAGSAMEIES